MWLLLLMVPLTWCALRWFAAMSPSRRGSAIAMRFVLIAIIAAMLAGLSRVQHTDRLAVIAVVDASGSIRRFVGQDRPVGNEVGLRAGALELVQQFIGEATARRGPDDLAGIVVFDGRAVAVATPTRADISGRDIDIRVSDGTNIADAIRLARAMIPPDAAGRLLLFSDGNQTAGDALAAAAEVSSAQRGLAAGASVPVDVVPLRYQLVNEVVVESVDAPPSAAAESSVNVRIALHSTVQSQGTLQLLREGEPVDLSPDTPGVGRPITLQPGLNVEFVEVRLRLGRVHRFRAIYEPDTVLGPGDVPQLSGDTITENNRGETFTISPGRGSVLLADGVSGGHESGAGATLGAALRASGVDVVVVAPEEIPDDLLSLQAFDAVILQNVPAEVVPERTQEQLVAYVRDMGGGLVMVGGPDSFGAGGWKGTPLEPILPVRLDLPDRLLAPETATVFVLDNSGSMRRFVLGSAKTQQELANDAAALAIRTLDKRDLIGVVVFNSDADVLIPLGPNEQPKESMDVVRGIASGGGTNLGPGLELARRQLAGVTAKVKHVVVLSDGKSRGSDLLPAHVEAMRREGIRVSTIAVGDDADLRTMSILAERGGGEYFHAINPNMLPRIFLKAVRLVRTPLIREAAFAPVVLSTGSPITAGLEKPPALGGLVLTQVRMEPTVINAMVTPTGEPLLSHWNAGLGQVVAFTSDAHHWASAWLEWPGYQQMWTQAVRMASRPAAARGFQASSQATGDNLHLRLEASGEDGRPLDGLDVPATVYAPSGSQRQVRLTQTGPGVYEAQVEASETGSYMALLKPARGEERLSPTIVGSTVLEGAEYRARQSNDHLLAQVAASTSGRVLELDEPKAADLFNRAGVRPREAIIPLWKLLITWALVAFMLDVATRRVAWDRWVSRQFRPEAATDAVGLSGTGVQVQKSVESLRSRLEPADIATIATEHAGAAPIALGDEDARSLQMAARDRRRAERLAGLRADTGERASTPPAPTTKPADGTALDPGGSGLLAAKRRALDRFEAEDEDQSASR